jgi:hypothetical protein
MLEANARSMDQETAASVSNQYSNTIEQLNNNKSVLSGSTTQMELSSESQPLRIRSTYNPSTPRAMVFNPDDTHIGATLVETKMGSEREQQLPSWFTVERKMGD